MTDKRKSEQEDFYEAFLNKSGEIMLSIAVRDAPPEDARILYDGGEHALFYRTKEQTILLDYLHPEIREPLSKVTHVLISEVSSDRVEREYEVPLRMVKKIPLDKKGIIPPNEVKRLFN